ncbi:MAG: hypothetical protein IPJ19_20160 [Planctomycetes bacterium]|nr:hypothetical protein [Planctomycetota bacterium]
MELEGGGSVTSKPYVMDPELEGLLREAARDPRSTLFRRRPARIDQRLALVEQPCRQQRERPEPRARLLDVWRHELAEILYQAALRAFAQGAGGALNALFAHRAKPP